MRKLQKTNVIIRNLTLILKYWDKEKNDIHPKDIPTTSRDDYYFICEFGHSYHKKIQNFLKNQECPICRLEKFKRTNKVAKNLALIKEYWDYDKNDITPEEIPINSKDTYHFKCKYGHPFQKGCDYFIINPRCPICRLKRKRKGSSVIKNLALIERYWDYDKNDISTKDIPPNSQEDYYFKCDCRHSFHKKIQNFLKNHDCPICRKKKLNKITKNLALFQQYWDYEKNDILPEDIPADSKEGYYFKCNFGHSVHRKYQSFLDNPECPQCRLAKNSILAAKPHIVDWWDYTKNGDDLPELNMKTSSKVVHWKCPKCGYEWPAKIASRYASKDMCPCCDLNLVLKEGVNDALTRCPEIKRDWDYTKNKILPQNCLLTYEEPVYWKCGICGYEWVNKLITHVKKQSDGTYKLTSCKCCRGKISYAGARGFREKFPYLANEYVPELNTVPLDSLTEKSSQLIMWRCSKCNQLFPSSPNTRTRFYPKSTGCPYCNKKKPIKGENDFPTYCKENNLLWPLEEWDYDANKCGPEEFLFSSMKKISLYCSKNPEHKWETTCYACTHGCGRCPQCYPEKKPQKFATAHPELLPYWDYIQNKKDPTKIAEYSNEEAHWICDQGHKFQHHVFKFSLKGFYCPICDFSRLVVGINDFETLYPALASEWSCENSKSPREVIPNSSIPILWDCPEGHPPYERAPRDRVKNALAGCPVCMKTKVVEGINDAKTFYPRLEPFWNHHKNNKKTLAMIHMESPAKHDFICELGHEFRETIPQMIQYGYTCACCEDRIVLAGFNSIADLLPNFAKEWDYTHRYNQGLIPSEVGVLAKIIRAWICAECGTPFNASIPERVSGEKGCPVCMGKIPWPGKTSLLAVHPDIAPELISHDPDKVFPSAITIGEWECPICKRRYKGPINLRVSGELDCPFCAGKRVIPDVNSLRALFPIDADEYCYDDRDPDTISPEFHIKGRWKCSECGGIWTCEVYEKTHKIKTCPYCAGKLAIPGVTSILALYPDIAKELVGKDPDHILPTSKDYCNWHCNACNQTWPATVEARVNGVTSCPYCAGKRTIPGVTSLLVLYPDIAKELVGKDPDHILPTSKDYCNWHCNACNQTWPATVEARVNGVTSCPYCAGEKAIPGVNSVKEQYPDILNELDELANVFNQDIGMMLPTSTAKMWCKCKDCGHYYPILVRNKVRDIKRKRNSCPHCKGYRRKHHYII